VADKLAISGTIATLRVLVAETDGASNFGEFGPRSGA
jgi:hypothetical protein